jgi:twinkle protein
LAHRFGTDRCWRVQWPDMNDCPTKDANEALIEHGAEAVQESIKLATPYPIDGVYAVEDYAADVLDIYRGNVAQPISTGFPLLDTIYRVMPGTFCAVTGIPNHGKSSFMDQIAVNLARQESWRFAVFSPEQSVANHIRRLSEKVAAKPFDVGPTHRMTEGELQLAMEFLSKHFHFIESRDTVPNIDWILAKSRAACVRHGVKGIIIDPYNEIDATRTGGKREDEHIRDMISACKQFNRRHNTAMWMVAHPSKLRRQDNGDFPVPTMYDISGAAHWHNMADAGLVVHRDFTNEQTRVITRKIREQGLYGTIGEAAFRFNVTTRVFEEEMTEAARPFTETD